MQSKTELNLCYSFLWATKKWRARVCECFPFPRSSQGLCASDFVVTHHFNLIVHLEVVPFIKRYIFNICMMVSSSDNNSFFLAFQGENTTLRARYYRALYDVARIETTWGKRKKKKILRMSIAWGMANIETWNVRLLRRTHSLLASFEEKT